MAQNVYSTTDQNFENDVLKSDHLSLIDFWAAWCGPCRQLEPVIEKIANDFAGQNIKIYKMNVDENPQTPARYHVRGIPTMMFFKNGQLVEQLVGYQPESKITEAIQRHL